jgi:hypothetical protein
MKPADFRPWAEEQLAKSPHIRSVEGVQDDRPENSHITYTHVTFPTGAKVIIHWVGSDPLGGKNVNPDGSPVVTGPPPTQVPVPELASAGRLKLLDIETHLAAVLNNGGHAEVAEALGYHQRPDPLRGKRTMQYGLHVGCHSGEAVTGMFIHTLPAGRQPTPQTLYQQLDEL